MVKSTSTLILATVVACTLISLAQCGVVDLKGPILDTWFFRKLNIAEQRALMSLAIAYHDTPESDSEAIIFPTNPIKPKADEIPPTLFTTLMNGEVPKQWMKRFIYWLKTEKRITNNSLHMYRSDESVEILCTEDNHCYNITDVGQQCCPFG